MTLGKNLEIKCNYNSWKMSGEGWILCMTVWYYEGRLWYIKDGLVKSRHTTVKEERLLLGKWNRWET